MRFARSLVLASTLAAAICLPAFADSDLIINGSFETGDFTGWTLTDTVFTTVQPSGFDGITAADGNYFAALGNVLSDGVVSQTFADTPGQSYTLSFYVANDGETPNDFVAYLNGTSILAFSDSSAFPFTQYTYNFTGTGVDGVYFEERNDNGYLGLDDVSVTGGSSIITPSATPEPSSLALLATGMLGVAGTLRRRLVRG